MAIDYNRQYVGARYVPKFFENPDGSWDWAAGFQYEPLTMVKYGSNTFTSKKLVPSTIGSPNNNSEYWANTGDYTGAINALQQSVLEINNWINNSQTLKNKKILMVADSYGGSTGWTGYVSAALAANGIPYDVVQQNGAGFTTQIKFYDLYINSPTPSEYTDVIVGGGINDTGTTQELINAGILQFANACKANNSKFHFLNFGDCWNNPTRRGQARQNNLRFQRACALYNVNFPYNAFGVLHSPSFFQSDGVHPTEAASILLGELVSNYIFTEKFEYNLYYSYSTDIMAYFKNGYYTLDCNRAGIYTEFTISVNTEYNAGNAVSIFHVFNPTDAVVYISGYFHVLTATGNKFYPGKIKIENGNAYITLIGNPETINATGCFIYVDNFTVQSDIL